MKQMNVLFVTAECAGFASVGGLAEVAGSLPRALTEASRSCKVRVVMPLYRRIADKYGEELRFLGSTVVNLAWRHQYAGLFTLKRNGIDYYFVDNKYYFDRPSVYGDYDDGEKYAFFSKSIFDLFTLIGNTPDIIHCNDWHTALVCIYLDILYKKRGIYMDIKSVFTIHNIGYQGIFGTEFLGDVIGIDQKYRDLLIYNGLVNLMKGAIVCADMITTVSPRYAREIATSNYACGLENIIRTSLFKIRGIINGIDYDSYNPLTDPVLYARYDVDSFTKKSINKKRLIEELGLPEGSGPLLASIGRLVPQKGTELIAEAMRGFTDLGALVIILGTGDKETEDKLRKSDSCHHENVKIIFAYDETLARKIYAGSDIFLMPSKTEPCGLSQMIACRYGSVPVVRATGGLYDTIEDYNPEKAEGNGFVFRNFDSSEFYRKVREAILLYRKQPEAFEELAKRCMRSDFGWKLPAEAYLKMYRKLIKKDRDNLKGEGKAKTGDK